MCEKKSDEITTGGMHLVEYRRAITMYFDSVEHNDDVEELSVEVAPAQKKLKSTHKLQRSFLLSQNWKPVFTKRTELSGYLELKETLSTKLHQALDDELDRVRRKLDASKINTDDGQTQLVEERFLFHRQNLSQRSLQ